MRGIGVNRALMFTALWRMRTDLYGGVLPNACGEAMQGCLRRARLKRNLGAEKDRNNPGGLHAETARGSVHDRRRRGRTASAGGKRDRGAGREGALPPPGLSQ